MFKCTTRHLCRSAIAPKNLNANEFAWIWQPSSGSARRILRAMAKIQPLLDIMVRLRDPETGCAWDRAQDFSSISPFTVEEAYEVDDAIASGRPDAIRDELGDLLFQVVFQARIAEEQGLFGFEEITQAICAKLIRRHPHIFGDAAPPQTIQDQSRTWEAIKAAERSSREAEGERDPFAGIPRRLPALSRSTKVASRLAGAADAGRGTGAVFGEDHSLEGALRAAAAAGAAAEAPGTPEATREHRRACVGAGLRAWVHVARALGVDAEQALREADDAKMADVRSRLTNE